MPTAPKLNQKERRRFFETLAAATDERAVQEAYEAGFKILFPGAVFIYPCKCDGYLDWDMFLRLLCEYKLDERLNDPPQRAKVLVQVLFYLKLFEENGIELPSVLFVGDRNECFLLHSNAVLPFLDTPDVDWSLPPSSAWQKLPSLLARMTQDCAPNVFVYPVVEGRFELADVVAKLQDLAGNIVRHVRATPANVQRMYDYFCERVLPNAKLSPNDSVGCFFAAILNDTDTYLHPKEPSTLVWRGTPIRINRAGWDAYFAHYDNSYTPRERAAFTAISAYSFMIFNLLCAPCFAAMGAIKREMNSPKWTLAAIGYMCGFAYVISLMVYQLGGLIMGLVPFGVGTVAALVCLGGLIYLLVRKNKYDDAALELRAVAAVK